MLVKECGMVFRKNGSSLRDMLNYMGRNGYRHHVAITRGHWAESIREAFENYLGISIDTL